MISTEDLLAYIIFGFKVPPFTYFVGVSSVFSYIVLLQTFPFDFWLFPYLLRAMLRHYFTELVLSLSLILC